MTERNPRKLQKNQPRDQEEQVRHRAYQIYEERGREDGHDLDDWLKAENEIAAKHAQTAAA